MIVLINQGSGPVYDATESQACENMSRFVEDVRARFAGSVSWSRNIKGDSEGRFHFVLFVGDELHTVDMPGLPIDRVRYVSHDQDIREFLRLYVDGSSWIWKFAVDMVLPE